MTNVLILGKTGMLGRMLYYYFSKLNDYKVFSTSRSKEDDNNLVFDVIQDEVSKLSEFVSENKIDYIINAIGMINRYCRDNDVEGTKKALLVNSYFPYKLSEVAKSTHVKIIQIATDCVFSGKVGNYNEDSTHDALDVYGKTKSLGEIKDKKILHIRCSIIGPEKNNKASLLEWFLNSKETSLDGYLHHRWNGVTTLRFSKLVHEIIEKNMFNKLIKESYIYHYVPNYSLSKYEMLILFNKVFNKSFNINSVRNVGSPVDRTLSSKFGNIGWFNKINFEQDLIELKEVIDGGFYEE